MEKNFSDIYPILDIDQDLIISKKGDITAAFEISKSEIYTIPSEGYESLSLALIKAVSILPVRTVVHFQDWYTTGKYKANFQSAAGFLAGASERHFHERSFLEHRAYLFLTYRPKGRNSVNSAGSGLFGKTLCPPEILRQEKIQSFLDSVRQFQKIVEDCKLWRLRRLPEAEIWSYAGRTGILEQYCYLTQPREAGVIKDIALRDGIRIGEKYCLLYSIADAEKLPPYCYRQSPSGELSTTVPVNIGFAARLGVLLPVDHIFNQYIFLEDNQAILRRLEKNQRRLLSLSKFSRNNGAASESINAFLYETLRDQHNVVKAHFNVLAWTDSREAIHDIRSKVSAALTSMGISPHEETIGAGQIWYAGIPGNPAEMPVNECFDCWVEQAICFLALETNYRSSTSSSGIRLGDRISGKPVFVDISEEPRVDGTIGTKNKFVLGGSGSGKSFFTNHLMRCYYEQGCHILVVDIGHSYKGLCRLVDGYYFTCTDTELVRYNPFRLPEGGFPGLEKKDSILTLLRVLWKKDDEPFLRSEYVTLSNALQAYYAWLEQHPEIFPCFDSFYEFLRDCFMPRLAGEQVKEKDFNIRNFLYVLRPYYNGGEYDYLLNARENLDLLHQRFIVFELDVIKEHAILFPVTTIILMEVFLQKMRRLPGVRKVILIEEAWKAIARTGMEGYIQYLFKTVRKFNGEAIVVTQEIEDILSSPVVKQAILGNTGCRILMDMSQFRNKFDQVRDLLGLTEHDAALALSVNKAREPGKRYKEVFISLVNAPSKVYRTEVSLEEYLTYTTEESEKLQVESYAVRYGSYQKGIEMLANDIRQGAAAIGGNKTAFHE